MSKLAEKTPALHAKIKRAIDSDAFQKILEKSTCKSVDQVPLVADGPTMAQMITGVDSNYSIKPRIYLDAMYLSDNALENMPTDNEMEIEGVIFTIDDTLGANLTFTGMVSDASQFWFESTDTKGTDFMLLAPNAAWIGIHLAHVCPEEGRNTLRRVMKQVDNKAFADALNTWILDNDPEDNGKISARLYHGVKNVLFAVANASPNNSNRVLEILDDVVALDERMSDMMRTHIKRYLGGVQASLNFENETPQDLSTLSLNQLEDMPYPKEPSQYMPWVNNGDLNDLRDKTRFAISP